MTDYRECQFSSHDGLRLYYRDYGSAAAPGVPLLCLSGLTRNSHDFHPVASRLSAQRRVVCLDYRGRGRSAYDPDPSNYDPRTYVGDIRDLLVVAGLHRVVVLGVSLGGLLAMAVGAAMPTVLAGAVLNDIGPEIDGSGFDLIMDYIARDHPHPNWDEAVADLKRMMPGLNCADEAEWLNMARGTWREGKDGLLHYDWDIRIAEPLKRMRALPDLWPLFGTLRRVPVLALRGERSEILSAAAFDRMAAYMPQMQRVTVKDAGHVPTLMEPESVAALTGFLEGIPA